MSELVYRLPKMLSISGSSNGVHKCSYFDFKKIPQKFFYLTFGVLFLKSRFTISSDIFQRIDLSPKERGIYFLRQHIHVFP
jgi:hypothetical protein